MTIPVRSLRLLPKPKKELDRLSGNKGEIFYDSTSNSLRIFDGTIPGGTLLNASVSVRDTPPDNPTQGSLWFNSTTGAFYIYYQDGSSNQWIAPIVPAGLLGSSSSSSGDVLAGLAGKLAYYPANGTAVNDLTEVSWGANALNIAGAVTATGQKSRVRFHWETLANLESEVNATTYQGMIAYAADSARPYFAHNGTWVALAKESEIQTSSSFSTIAVSGQSNLVADQSSDILTVIAGTNITITTDAISDAITISSNINLSNYATTSSVTTALSGYATTSSVTTALSGYATTSSVTTGLSGKEDTITAGTTSQYWRGDKSWQSLDASAVGLGNVTDESKATLFTSPSFTGSTVTLANSQKLVWGGSTGPWISSGGVGYALQMGWQNGTTNLTFDSSNVTVSGASLTIGAYGETGSIYWANGFGRMYANTSGGNRLTIEGPTDNGSGDTGSNASVTLIPGSTLSGTQGTARIIGLTSVDDLTVGGLATFQETTEVITPLTGATGVIEHIFYLGAIWEHSSIAANFTANFTGIPTTNNRVITLTLLLVQGATPYIPSAVQLEGNATTVKWLGGTTPTGNALKTDIVSFTILRTTVGVRVLGSLSSYG